MTTLEFYREYLSHISPQTEMVKNSFTRIESFVIPFFNGIDDENARVIPLVSLIEEIYRYYYNKKMAEKEVFSDKPNKLIESDIKTIRKYQAMVERLYNTPWLNHTGLLGAPKEIIENYENNKKILLDLENKQFKIINKNKYSNPQTAKNKIKEIVGTIQKDYNLKALDAKQLVDSI